MQDPQKLLTSTEVAKVLRTRPESVRAMLGRGEIPGAFRLFGRFWRVPLESLSAYVTSQGKQS